MNQMAGMPVVSCCNYDRGRMASNGVGPRVTGAAGAHGFMGAVL